MERLTFSREFEKQEGVRREDITYIKPELAIKMHNALAAYEDLNRTPAELASDLAELETHHKAFGGADDEIMDHYEMLVREYALELDEKLTRDAKELKTEVLKHATKIVDMVAGKDLARLAEYDRQIKAGELVEVVHGEWSDAYVSGYKPRTGVVCTACDCWSANKTSICAHCGARMEEQK